MCGRRICGAAAEQHHLRQHPQHDGHQQRHQQAASAGLPGAVPGVRAGARANGRFRFARRGGCAGAGRRHADAAACRRAKGHADPAGQIAGAAERCDQSRGENRFARRSGRPDRNAERDAAGECAERAASEPVLAEAQCAAGSRRQGGAARAPERRGIAAGRSQSKCEACAGATPPASAAPATPGAATGSGRLGATAPAAPAGSPRPGASGPAPTAAPAAVPDAARNQGSVRRHPAPPRRRGRPRLLRRDLSCSPKFGVRRHLPRCTWRGRPAGCPRCATAATAEGGGATAAGGRPAASDGRAVATPTEDGCTAAPLAAPPPPPRMAAPPPRPAAPLQRRQPRDARRMFRNADCFGR